jgi:hypothetical protein
MSEAINLSEKLELFDEHWQPKIVAKINDYQDQRLRRAHRQG